LFLSFEVKQSKLVKASFK